MLLSSDPRPRIINNGLLLRAICLNYIYEKSGKNSVENFRLTSDDSWHCGQLQCSKTHGRFINGGLWQRAENHGYQLVPSRPKGSTQGGGASHRERLSALN